MVKLEYEYVKNFIESKGCKLLDDVYSGNSKKLNILFSCGHIDQRTFSGFQGSAPLCRRCTKHGSISEDEVEENLLKYGYRLISRDYFQMSKKISIQDNDGYKYYTSYCTLLQEINKDARPWRFDPRNIYTIENIRLFLKLNGNKLFLEENEVFKRSKHKMTFYDDEGYKYYYSFDMISGSIKNNNGNWIVNKFNKYSLDNMSLWLEKNNKPFMLLENQEYKNNNGKLKFKCLNCHEDENCFESTWADISMGGGCPFCTHNRVGKYNNFAYLFPSPSIADEWDYVKNYPITPKDIMSQTNKKYWWICPNCNRSYHMSPSYRNGQNKCNCPKCAKSKGEKIVEEYFITNKIYYSSQYRFIDCRDIMPLPFDFAIFQDEEKKILLGITEYDGELHYFPYRMMKNKEENLLKTQLHDEIKNKYCEDHNIFLLRIPYWDKANIKEILDKEILSLRKEVI